MSLPYPQNRRVEFAGRTLYKHTSSQRRSYLRYLPKLPLEKNTECLDNTSAARFSAYKSMSKKVVICGDFSRFLVYPGREKGLRRINGGGGSLERTALQAEFPGISREFALKLSGRS